jgi:Protein of unknown function (DUF3365)
MKPQNRVALPIVFSFVAMLIVLALSTRGAGSGSATSPGDIPALPPPSNGAISPQDQADALHFVIAADREMYCQEFIAQQKESECSPNATASTKSGDPWPLPSEMLRRAAESIQSKGAEFSYALRSLHPTDPRDGPQTELEQRGLAFVTSHPTQNYYGQEMLGGRRYFTAIYPDIPAVEARVAGHDRSSTPSPQRRKVGDIPGGIVVRVPLEF